MRAGEAALAASREEAEARERLIGVLGHDLRAPLTAIKASVQLARRAPEDRQLVDMMLEGVQSAADRMHRMIGDLFDFTRGRLGEGIPVNPRDADLDTIVQIVTEELRRADADADIEVAQAGGLQIQADSDRLAQVVSNLVSNALQYRATSSPVKVATCGDATTVTLRVSNEGPPIPPEIRPQLFSPFRRGENITPRDGLGLGLYIAKEIVAKHGGTIEASSSGGWNHFDVHLPRKSARTK